MSAITVNSFPSLHSFTSPRSWFLAIIVLLHVGFFWALSSGLSKQVFEHIAPGIWVPVPAQPRPTPPPRPIPIVDGPVQPLPYVPAPPLPRPEFPDEGGISGTPELPPYTAAPTQGQPRQVIVVEPEIDSRRGLSEPIYPSASIRMNQTGTVTLSVQVLENGRVGAIRIEQSSGHSRLDEAAVREARLWRLIPATRDGVPIVMWKQIPITFRLQN